MSGVSNTTTGKTYTGGDVIMVFFSMVIASFHVGQVGASLPYHVALITADTVILDCHGIALIIADPLVLDLGGLTGTVCAGGRLIAGF